MAEIHVPKDAHLILDKIIKLAQQVESNNNYLTKPGVIIGKEELIAIDQVFEELKSAIDIIGYKWCNMNPLLYHHVPGSESSFPRYLCFSREDKNDSDCSIDIPVPNEIYEILVRFSYREVSVKNYEFPVAVRQLLSNLRKKIIAQSNMDTLTPRLFDEESINRKQSFTLSEDNRTAYLNGDHILNVKEGSAIRFLYERWQQGSPNVVKNVLIDIACGKQSSVTEVRLIFSKRETYKALVKYVGKGLYRLNI